MAQVNIDELKEGVQLAKDVIEGNLTDTYITKRLLKDNGLPEDDLDAFIRGKVREYDRKYSAMDDEEFQGNISLKKEKLHERAETKSEQLIDFIEEEMENPEIDANPLEMIWDLLNMINLRIDKVMFVKRGMIYAGVDPDDIAMAISDTAKEYNERFMKMPEDELLEMMHMRVMEKLKEDLLKEAS